MSDAVETLSARLGILPSYIDLDRQKHVTGRDTQIALLGAMGIDAQTTRAARQSLSELDEQDSSGDHPEWCVVVADTVPKINLGRSDPWQIVLEDGSTLEGRGADDLPRLPMGRHLLLKGARKIWLLSAPETLPRAPRDWGVTAPLAALRTATEGGIGNFQDLENAALAIASKGAAFFGINPVHAGFPTDETAFSPYSPSHRQWLNTAHIVTGATPEPGGPLIDYTAETRRGRSALRAAYESTGHCDAFAEFLSRHGNALERFATHQALSESHGPYWRDWPAPLRVSAGTAVTNEAEALGDEIRFHAWAQYKAETQLAQVKTRCDAAGMAFGLYLDLAVGTHPYGAETWENPELFAKGVSLGAPPDAFAPDGQSWNLAPFVPRAMVAEGFATLAAILRRQFQFAKLLRIDHILGFDRAFWATNEPGLPGAYVEMPLAAMLAVTRIEAARAGATVIGEDLGNIPTGLQSALRSSGLLGCRLIMFEHDVSRGGGFKRSESYDARTMTSFSTHDLPTWLGWREGADISARQNIAQVGNAQTSAALSDRKAEVAAFEIAAGERTMHAFLADTSADLVAVQIENVFDVVDQPNLPGTIDAYPNWRQRLPVAVENYATDTRLEEVADTMKKSGR
ncbi:MAG: 4-alpha-glucanotransferase [Silicimonas sp.]|nr:4-alpha-glucanotransferase [Silicimonas sp.]